MSKKLHFQEIKLCIKQLLVKNVKKSQDPAENYRALSIGSNLSKLIPRITIKRLHVTYKHISTDSIDILPYCCPSNMITGTQLSDLVKFGCKDGYSFVKARIYVVS